jgi:hypothetical protein
MISLDPAAYLQAIKSWQHEVQDHHVRPLGGNQLNRAGPVPSQAHQMPVTAKPGRNRRSDTAPVKIPCSRCPWR